MSQNPGSDTTTDPVSLAKVICEKFFVSDQAVAAVGIGGSIGHGSWDQYSDIDIFVYTDMKSIDRLMGACSSWLEQCVPVDVTVAADYFPGYGVRSASIVGGERVVETFFVAIELLQPSTMQHKTQLLFDRQNVKELLKRSLSASHEARRDTVIRLSYDFLATSIKLLKAVARGNAASAYNRLHKLRSIAVVAVHWTRCGELLNVLEADGSGRELQATYKTDAISMSYVHLSVPAVIDAYQLLRREIRLFLQEFAVSVHSAAAVCRREEAIYERIMKVFHD